MFGKIGVGKVAGEIAAMGCVRFQEKRVGHSLATLTAYPNYMHTLFPYVDWDCNNMPKLFKSYRAKHMKMKLCAKEVMEAITLHKEKMRTGRIEISVKNACSLAQALTIGNDIVSEKVSIHNIHSIHSIHSIQFLAVAYI